MCKRRGLWPSWYDLQCGLRNLGVEGLTLFLILMKILKISAKTKSMLKDSIKRKFFRFKQSEHLWNVCETGNRWVGQSRSQARFELKFEKILDFKILWAGHAFEKFFMKRVFYEKIGQYLGREFRILKLLGHGRRHYRISGQGSADNFVPGPIPEKPPWGLPSTVQCSRTKSRISPRSPDWGCPLSPISGSLASSTRGMGKIGIRREDALIYERRCPLIPSHVGELVKQGWGCVQLLSDPNSLDQTAG